MPAIYPAIRPVITELIAPEVEGSILTMEAQFAAFMAALTGPRVLLDPSRAASRFQDAAGSSLVTADGQPFARLNDASGAGNHVSQSTAASMPLYRTDGVLHWAEFDGSNDSWATLANLDLTSTDKITIIVGLRKNSDVATGMALELSANIGLNNGAFYLTAPSGAGQSDYIFSLKGTVGQNAQALGNAAPTSSVITASGDIAAAASSIRVNGVATPKNASLGTGALGSYPLYIGRRGGTTLPFNGRLYGLIVIGRLLTTDERSLCERWMAGKTGVTL